MRRLRQGGFVAGLFMAIAPSAWADCELPADSSEQLRCASAELRATDHQINEVYGNLRTTLSTDGQLTLRNEQRAWLRMRDQVCALDRSINDRELWFKVLESDPLKMTCVIRFTTERNKRLRTWLEGLDKSALAEPVRAAAEPPKVPPAAPPPAPPAATGAGIDEGVYEIYAPVMRSTGKWYFELEFQPSQLGQRAEMAVTLGVAQQRARGAGWMMRIGRNEATMNLGAQAFAVAVDLDEGFAYFRAGSGWEVEPGSAGGVEIKPRLPTRPFVGGTVDLTPMLAAGLFKANFGDRPFRHTIPAGYKAYSDGLTVPQSPP